MVLASRALVLGIDLTFTTTADGGRTKPLPGAASSSLYRPDWRLPDMVLPNLVGAVAPAPDRSVFRGFSRLRQMALEHTLAL
jgi:hypothetical protein